MAQGPGCNLNDTGAGCEQTFRVIVRLQIADDNPDPVRLSKFLDSLLNKSRFSRAGGRQNVEDQQAKGVKKASIPFGQPVIGSEYGFVKFDLLAMGMFVFMLMGVRMLMGVPVMRVFVNVFVTGDAGRPNCTD
jgi:hypothetical protein